MSTCGECDLIDWCGDPYKYPHLCAEPRFDEVEVEDYIRLAKKSKCGDKEEISDDVYKMLQKQEEK